MCLLTQDPTIKTAEKDIQCYKEHQSFFFGWLSYHSRGGFAYFTGCPVKTVDLQPIHCTAGSIVLEGYHTHKLIDSAGNSAALFIIPKGATYIEGWYNDCVNIPNYVSSNLVYIGRAGSIWSSIVLGIRNLFNNLKP